MLKASQPNERMVINIKNNLKKLIPYAGSNKSGILITLLLLLIGNICILIAPKTIAAAVEILSAESFIFNELLKLLLIIAFLYIAGSYLTWSSTKNAYKIAYSMTNQLSEAMFFKLGRLPISSVDKKSHGNIINTFSNDIDAIAVGASGVIYQFFNGIISIVISVVMMLSLDFRVALVVFFVTPLCFFTGWLLSLYGKKKFTNVAKNLGELGGVAEEYINAANTVRDFGYETTAISDFEKINNELYQNGYRAQFASALINPTTRYVNNFAYILVGIFSVIAVINGDLTIGGLTAFLIYVNQFSKPFNEISSIIMQLQTALASSARIFDFLGETEETDDYNLEELHVKNGEVIFDNISFSYDPAKELIKNLSMKINAGTKVAVVGPSGAGKTTLVNLLMRFYDLNNGSILLDGNDISKRKRGTVRQSYGMVLQDTWLFSGTVRENIKYGNPDIDDAAMFEAAKNAHAHNFIMALPDGYDTNLSSNGNILSTGQRQLLTIARAMLVDSSMLILDEATSNIDVMTEIAIQKTFADIMENKTTFIIAHRLSTIKNCDIIIVMDRGNVVDYGSHDDLIKNCGLYSELVKKSLENPSEM